MPLPKQIPASAISSPASSVGHRLSHVLIVASVSSQLNATQRNAPTFLTPDVRSNLREISASNKLRLNTQNLQLLHTYTYTYISQDDRPWRWWPKGPAPPHQLHIQAPPEPRDRQDLAVRAASHPHRGKNQGTQYPESHWAVNLLGKKEEEEKA